MSQGPFYFAWVDPEETAFDPDAHNREDEQIVQFSCEHTEGDFAALSIDIKNRRDGLGLLRASHKKWAWLSWYNGSEIVPLFFGRMIGAPTNINKEVVTLQLIARPANFTALKEALAETLKVRPFYDPVWLRPEALADPDTVLEARSALWAIDRVNHTLSASDILSGEDGIEVFTADEVPYDNVDTTINQAPLRSVSVDAFINWTQGATGVIDMGTKLFRSYTGGSLLNDWPKPGAGMGSGWSCESSFVTDVWGVKDAVNATYTYNYQNKEDKHENGDTMTSNVNSNFPILNGGLFYVTTLPAEWAPPEITPDTNPLTFQNNITFTLTAHRSIVIGDPSTGRAASASVQYTYAVIPLWLLNTGLSLRYNASRGRGERVRFTLKTNTQPIVTDAGEEETAILSLSSVDVGLPLVDATVPIENVARRSYLKTARGLRSLEYLIALARNKLIMNSRAVQTKFTCTFERAINMSLRKNARLLDARFAGGEALGKIVTYSFRAVGDTGEMDGTVTIASSVGYGGAVVALPGDPVYAAPGYMAPCYQQYVGQTVVPTGGDVSYTVPIDPINDDGLNFPLTRQQVVIQELVHGNADDQKAAIIAASPNDAALANSFSPTTVEEQKAIMELKSQIVKEVMKTNSVWYELQLRPVNGANFLTEYDIMVSDLEIPKMIDLEAA